MTKRPDPAFHTLTTGAAYSQEAAIDKIGPPALQEVTMVVNLAWRLSRLAVMPRDRPGFEPLHPKSIPPV
jgi:hypothetical protein